MIIKEDYGTLTGGELAVESLIAPVQKTLIADKTYNVGNQFIYDDKLYKVTVLINATDNIVIGTNAELADDITTQMNARADIVSRVNIPRDNTFYECPSDGFLAINVKANQEMDIAIYGAVNNSYSLRKDIKNTTGTGMYDCIYLKKGMRVRSTWDDTKGYIVFHSIDYI